MVALVRRVRAVAAERGPPYGFGWLMAALLVFSGTQLVMLGLIGEYIGRMFLTVNQRPQAVVREVVRSQTVFEHRSAAADRARDFFGVCAVHGGYADALLAVSWSGGRPAFTIGPGRPRSTRC